MIVMTPLDKKYQSIQTSTKMLFVCIYGFGTLSPLKIVLTVGVEFLKLWFRTEGSCGDVFAEDDDVAAGAERVESELLQNSRDPELVVGGLRLDVRLEASRRRRTTSTARGRVPIVLGAKRKRS